MNCISLNHRAVAVSLVIVVAENTRDWQHKWYSTLVILCQASGQQGSILEIYIIIVSALMPCNDVKPFTCREQTVMPRFSHQIFECVLHKCAYFIWIFAVVINTNLHPISHCFPVNADYWSHLHFWWGGTCLYCTRLGWTPKIRTTEFSSQDTRNIALSVWFWYICRWLFHFVTMHVLTDRQTERWQQ